MADLTSVPDVEPVVSTVDGEVDVLVNNAAVGYLVGPDSGYVTG